MSILLSVLQVILALVVFACAVLSNPHWSGYYGHRSRFDWTRYFDRPDDDGIIIIIQSGPSSANGTAAPNSSLPVTAGASQTAG